MAAALAKDLRIRVMVDVDAGMSAEKAGQKYSVSTRTIYHWRALRRETGGDAAAWGEDGAEAEVGGTSRTNSGGGAGQLGDHVERSA